MELWIRSQDREKLRKIVDIKYQKGTFEDKDEEVIIGTTQYDEWEVLGQYSTKERALKVLDEIQRKIDYIYELNLRPRAFTTIEHKKVYEMPEE